MLQKLRSRHPVDLPVSGYRKVKPLAFAIGTIAVLFVLVPLVVALFAGLTEDGGLDTTWAPAIAAGVGTLLLVLLVAGIRGKAGWNR